MEIKDSKTMERLMKGVMTAVKGNVLFLDRENKEILYTNLGTDDVEYATVTEDGKQMLDIDRLYKSLKNERAIDELVDCLRNQQCCCVEKKLEFVNGNSGWFRLQMESIRDEEGVMGTLLMIRNITDEYEKREKLIAATRKQSKAFMAMSHEFRTPINAISGSVDMLSLSENLNKKELSHIKNIKEAYKGLLNLVTKATDYTQIHNGELSVEEKAFTIHDILDNVRTLTHIRALDKGIGYCVDVAPDVPVKMLGDADKISRVLQSFLYNAIEHTEEGYVTLRIAREKEGKKEYIAYTVADTGRGIKEEFVGKIFEEFVGFDINPDNYVEGLGISLFVCKRIVELMGGTITCKSKYEEGSSFTFRLQLKAVEDKPVVVVNKPEDKSILLFTDIPWKKDLVKHMCESLHVPVMKCYNETDIETEKFSHIILDSHFGGTSELLEKKFPSGKKALVLESSKDKIEATKKADFIIYEPFTIMMFADMLNSSDTNKEEAEGQGKVGDLVFQVKDVKALVVDDNAVNLMVASNVLMQYGIEVEEADSGSMAVKKYYENDYDLIFMDYLMPDMNGVETIRNIRNLKRNRETIIIALTANVTDDIVSEFDSVGANHVMAKPLELKELSSVLKMYIPEDKFVKEESIILDENVKEEPLCPEADIAKEDVKSILHSVKGLNAEKGLANVMGAMETYVKILNVCCTNITEQAEYIKAAYELVASSGLKIYFHSLKGILANIGAEQLSEASKELEIAARDQNEAYIKENVTSYIKDIEEFRDNLKWAVNEYKKLSTGATLENYKPIKKKEYEEKIHALRNSIIRFEFNEINDLMEELIAGTQDEKQEILKKAYEAVGQFQYEEALELVETLK